METSLTVSQANRNSQEVNCNFEIGERLLVIRGRFNMRQNSWKPADEMALIDTILKGLPCPPIYIFKTQKEPHDEVFDGGHRFETSCGFVSNKIMIKKVKSDAIVWETSPLDKYVGKYFKDLAPEDKAKISNYKFLIHILDPKLAENPEELSALWVRLNNSGSKLNEYEMYKPIYHVFYAFLENESKSWVDSIVYPKSGGKNTGRGDPEIMLMKLLSLSEDAPPPRFSSQKVMYKDWRMKTFGNTSTVMANFAAKKSDFQNRFKSLHLADEFLAKHKIYDSVKTNECVYKFLLARIARWFDTTSKLNRFETSILEYARFVCEKTGEDHLARLAITKNHSATLQNKMIAEIDTVFRSIYSCNDNDTRFFTVAQKAIKLAEQKGECTRCNKPILPDDARDGHHVIPHYKGGQTVMENLAVLHKACHDELHARSQEENS
jgi:hypothetical protein